MDFPPFSFDSYQQNFEPSITSYHDHSMFTNFEDERTNEQNPINQAGLSQPRIFWNQASMQRFLNDTQRASLCNPLSQQLLPSNAHLVESTPPVVSLHRQESPSSSQELSSCSSAQSPGADTELFLDNMPSTPPNVAMCLSFQGPSFETFEPQSPFFLAGMGSFQVDSHSCVSMAEVSAGDVDTNEWKTAPPAIDFSPPGRNYTLESQTSACHHMDNMSRLPSTECEYKLAHSPALSAVVKEENSLPAYLPSPEAQSEPYPTPSIRDSEGSDVEIDVASSASEEGEDDDDEYRPDNKTRGSPSVRRTSRNKRDAPQSLEKESPKKAKTIFSPTTQSARPIPSSHVGSKASFLCTECSHTFKDEMTLQSHIKKQHTRPFICVFRFAGCASTFASKNEWKRHVMSQHLVLHYWLCDIELCAHNKNSLTNTKSSRRSKTRRAAESAPCLDPIGLPLPDGAIFNRKDLYTQHIRRMHTPIHVQKAAKASKQIPDSSRVAAAAEWEDQMKNLQTSSLRERCRLPVYMECPAPHCTLSFSGTDAWDQRMEHVARHLERAALGQEDPVVFGGPADPSLMDWVSKGDVAVVRAMGRGQWMLNNPLRAASEGRGVGRKREVALPLSSLNTTTASSVVGSSMAVSTSLLIQNESHVEDGEEDAEGEEE